MYGVVGHVIEGGVHCVVAGVVEFGRLVAADTTGDVTGLTVVCGAVAANDGAVVASEVDDVVEPGESPDGGVTVSSAEASFDASDPQPTISAVAARMAVALRLVRRRCIGCTMDQP